MSDPSLLEFIRPLAIRVPLEPLIVALYFGVSWSARSTVSREQFASDFHFTGREVEFLFATTIDDPALRRSVRRAKGELLAKLGRPFVLIEPVKTTVSTTERIVRDRAFTEAVREAYDYSCAVCRLRLDSVEGQWEVQAAHIYDRGLGGADDIRNGMALCRTHHWAFDRKLFTVGDRYELIWHPNAVRAGTARQGILHLPQGTRTWPDQQQALARHREKTLALWGAPQVRRSRTRETPPEYP